MRPLALPHRLNGYDQRCDHDDCRKVIPVGDAKLITRDSYNMARRFCAAFAAYRPSIGRHWPT